jgi:hypothetical protein
MRLGAGLFAGIHANTDISIEILSSQRISQREKG